MTTATLARIAEYDGMVDRLFPLAEKALQDGKFEKAQAYALLIQAAQAERAMWERQLRS